MPSGIPENATDQLKKLVWLLKILLVFQLSLGILNIFVDVLSGLMILIGGLILYLITYNRNWCAPVFYIVLCMMDSVSTIMLIGNYFTTHGHVTSEYGVLLFVSMIKLPFYSVSVFYTFLVYKELKALFLEMNLVSPNSFAQSQRNDQPSPNNFRQQPPQPFSGSGYSLN